MIRKLLRRLIKWAMADPKGQRNVSPINPHGIELKIDRSRAGEIFLRGASTPEGWSVIVNAIKTAQTNREL
jgi:hypothetical protein